MISEVLMKVGCGVMKKASVCGNGRLLDVVRMAYEVGFCHLV